MASCYDFATILAAFCFWFDFLCTAFGDLSPIIILVRLVSVFLTSGMMRFSEGTLHYAVNREVANQRAEGMDDRREQMTNDGIIIF